MFFAKRFLAQVKIITYVVYHVVVIFDKMFGFELGMDAQVAPECPAHVSEFECLSIGSNPGHKVTKKRV